MGYVGLSNWSNINKHVKNRNMAVIATKRETKKRELLAADNYMARCCKVVHIGTTEYEKNDTTYENNKAILYFEIIGAAEPTLVSEEVILDTNKDSKFRKLLNTWRGTDLTDEEAEAFDITVLAGKPCMVNVGHETIRYEGGSFDKEKVLSINKMPSSIKCPEGKVAPVVLDYDNWQTEVFDQLPNYIKKKIMASKEYKTKFNHEPI